MCSTSHQAQEVTSSVPALFQSSNCSFAARPFPRAHVLHPDPMASLTGRRISSGWGVYGDAQGVPLSPGSPCQGGRPRMGIGWCRLHSHDGDGSWALLARALMLFLPLPEMLLPTPAVNLLRLLCLLLASICTFKQKSSLLG